MFGLLIGMRRVLSGTSSLKIEFMEITIKKTDENSFDVSCDNRLADRLTYEEMLAVIIQLTIPDGKHCLQWLKTEEQRRMYEEYMNSLRK